MSKVTHAITTPIIPQWNLELLFKILDKIHDVVLVIDADSTIVYANEAYARSLGVPVAKVLGRRLDDIKRNDTGYVESLSIHTVGNTFPLYNGEEIVGAVSIFKNITEAHTLHRKEEQTIAQENPFDVKKITARVEKELILSALSNYNNNRSQAMRALGISRRAFYDKLRKYGIETL